MVSSTANTQKLKITKHVCLTVIIVAAIVGVSTILSIYVKQQSCSCKDGTEAPISEKLKTEEEKKSAKSDDDLVVAESRTSAASKAPIPVQLTLPKNLDFSVKNMMDKKNQKAHMNCMMEKKSSSELINHKPKTMQTPYGNLTTDPRVVHLTGQTVSVTCNTGTRNIQGPRNRPRPPPFPVEHSMRRGRMHRFPVLPRGKRNIESDVCQCACSC